MSLGCFIRTTVKIYNASHYREYRRGKNAYIQIILVNSDLNPYCFLHNRSVLSLFHLVGVFLSCLSTHTTEKNIYSWKIEQEYKNYVTISL